MKRSLVVLLPLFVLASCGNAEGSSSLFESSEEISSAESIFSSLSSNSNSVYSSSNTNNPTTVGQSILELANGFTFEGAMYMTEDRQGTISRYAMAYDNEIDEDHWAYKQYSPVTYSDPNNIPSFARKSIYKEDEFIASEEGFLLHQYRTIANTIESAVMVDEDDNEVEWSRSTFQSFFSHLGKNQFTQEENIVTVLVDSISDSLCKMLSYQFTHDDAYDLKELKLGLDGNHFGTLYAKFENFGPSRIIEEEFVGNLVAVNGSRKQIHLVPIEGSEKDIFAAYNASIAEGSYRESTTISAVDKKGNRTEVDSYYIDRDGDVLLYGGKYLLARLDEGYLYSVVSVGDKGYYVDGSAVGFIAENSAPFLSSLVLTANSDDTYSYKPGAKVGSTNLNHFCSMIQGDISSAIFTFRSNGDLHAEMFMNIGTSSYVVETTISKRNQISIPVDISEIHDNGDDLTFSDLFADFEYLETVQILMGGKENLDSIPVLGGKHNAPSIDLIMDPADNYGIQITYDLFNLFDFCIDGCGSVSEYDYNFYVAYVQYLMEQYSLRYDTKKWDVSKSQYNSYEMVNKTKFYEKGIAYRLCVEGYVGLDMSSYEAYFVIEAFYIPVRHPITFVYNIPGVENMVLYCEEGSHPQPSAPRYPGYEFMGWYLDAACTRKAGEELPLVTGSATYYAKWEAREDVTITFHYNYEGAPSNYVLTVPYDTQLVFSDIPAPTREGLEIYAWAIDAEGSAPAPIYDGVKESMDVYAVWVEAVEEEDSSEIL